MQRTPSSACRDRDRRGKEGGRASGRTEEGEAERRAAPGPAQRESAAQAAPRVPTSFGCSAAWVYRGTNLRCGRIPGPPSIMHSGCPLGTHHTLAASPSPRESSGSGPGVCQGGSPDSPLNSGLPPHRSVPQLSFNSEKATNSSQPLPSIGHV